MSERQKMIYRLGQVYGYICSKHTEWSSMGHDTQAARQPLQGVTVALFAAIHAGAVKADDEYIALRMDSVSADIADIQCCTIDEQGVFALGKMQVNRTPKKMIGSADMTQQALADKMGVSRETVSRWSSGALPLSKTARFKIEEILLDHELDEKA